MLTGYRLPAGSSVDLTHLAADWQLHRNATVCSAESCGKGRATPAAKCCLRVCILFLLFSCFCSCCRCCFCLSLQGGALLFSSRSDVVTCFMWACEHQRNWSQYWERTLAVVVRALPNIQLESTAIHSAKECTAKSAWERFQTFRLRALPVHFQAECLAVLSTWMFGIALKLILQCTL